MTTINKDNVFALVDKMVTELMFVECPFCLASYAGPLEFRRAFYHRCPVCRGYALFAEEAVEAVKAVYAGLQDLPETQETLDLIRSYIVRLGAGYDRSAYRTFFRELSDKLQKPTL